ncbi:hypothetical protein FOA52_012081 [Chlamydomonas sp. UWO 241]|nr:hypothetical protein FOA52_012081 [Chlamydomonas sp. UWO 241]
MASGRSAVALALCAVLALCSLSAVAAAAKSTSTITGKVMVPAGSASPADAVVHVHTQDGRHLTVFCDIDGSFAIRDLPRGKHMLQPFMVGQHYPEFRLDSTSRGGAVATYLNPQTKQLQQVVEPLLLRPFGEMRFYEARKSMDVLAIIKSPYGIMAIILLGFMFAMPSMKVEPEEYREFQKQIGITPDVPVPGQKAVKAK